MNFEQGSIIKLTFEKHSPQVSRQGPNTEDNPMVKQERIMEQFILMARRQGPKHQIC